MVGKLHFNIAEHNLHCGRRERAIFVEVQGHVGVSVGDMVSFAIIGTMVKGRCGRRRGIERELKGGRVGKWRGCAC